MESLMIDYDKIVRPNNLALLEQMVQPVPEPDKSTVLCLIIPKLQLERLEAVSVGPKRIEYINSRAFVEHISDHAYLTYDKGTKTCDILKLNDKSLGIVLKNILFHLPNDVTLRIKIPLVESNTDTMQLYARQGFGDPYIIKNDTSEVFVLRLSKLNEMGDTSDYASNMNKIKYSISQLLSGSETCSMRFRITNESVTQLKIACESGSTINKNGTISQKEISGAMRVKSIDGDLVHELEIDKKSIIYGKEEEVEIVKGYYGFHSHPKDAYKRNNVSLAWPSSADYNGFLRAAVRHDTITHLVSCIEGVYVISLSQYWAKRKEDLDSSAVESFINDNYGLCFEKGNTVKWYLNKAKGVLYKEYPIFNVECLPWRGAMRGVTTQVFFKRRDGNCATND